MEVNNLDKLADQIYEEGISKAKKESDEIIDKAKAKADKIINEARNEADRIVKSAEKERETQKERAANEIRLAGKKAINELQSQIRSHLSNSLVDTPVKDAFEDKDFVQQLLMQVLQKWDPQTGLRLEISDKLPGKVQEYLQKKVPDLIEGLEIKTTSNMSRGFVIENRDDGYFISFTEEDLRVFLKEYISDELQKLLFE